MKIPFDEEKTLAFLVQEEELELSSFDAITGLRTSAISTTEELSKEYSKPIELQTDTITFAPFKITFIALILIGLLFLGVVVNRLLNPNRIDGSGMLIPLVILLSIGVATVIFDNKRNFKIILSKDAITIRDFSYDWNQVNKFYIIRRPKVRENMYFLVLALDTGVTDRYELTNLMGFGPTYIKLSAYIEHFKHVAKQRN